MNKHYLTTAECSEAALNLGLAKTAYADTKTLLLGFMGGVFIALGCIGYLIASYSVGPLNPGLGKFLGGMIFPVGLILVVMVGGSLFTGDALIGVAWRTGEVSCKDYLKKLVLVWIGNLLGSMFLAGVTYFAHVFTPGAMQDFVVNIATHKAHLGLVESVASGFLCNILVALSVWLAFSSKDATGKLLAIFFPILLFIVSGFQHIVANMFYLSMGKMLNPGAYSLIDIIKSFSGVTLGNWLSGGLFIPVVYTMLFLKKKKSVSSVEVNYAK